MYFKTPVCQVICLVITAILHSVTAQVDSIAIEALIDHKFEKFEQKLMERLQAQNREGFKKQAASFENLECFINNLLAGQLELKKQISSMMTNLQSQNIIVKQENSREHKKLIEKLDAHATNVQQMTESINHLRNDTNGLLAGQLKNQNQLSSLTIDVQRLETHTDQGKAKLSDIYTLLRDTRLQNDQVIAKIDSHASNQMAEFAKNLRINKDDILTGQMELQKQMSNIMKENSPEQVKLIEKLDAHATNVQQMTESINHLRNDTNGLLAGQLKNQNQLTSITIDVQRLKTHTDQEEAKLSEIHTLLRDTRVQNDQVIEKIDTHASNSMAESAKNLRIIKDVILTGQFELRKEFSNAKNEHNSRVSDNEFQQLQNRTDAMYKEVIEKLTDHATNAQKIAESIKNLGNISDNLLAGQSENRKELPKERKVSSLIITNDFPSSCTTLNNNATRSYSIRPEGAVEPFLTRCDLEDNYGLGGGWTVFQHRYDGSVDFYRNWAAYRDGFGDVNAEHWLGLEKLHLMTKSGKHELLIIMEDFVGGHSYAHYNDFKIDSEDAKYKLTVGSYSGTAGDSLDYLNGEKFSTFDQDNDADRLNCAKRCHGAWWFRSCSTSHLNGRYVRKGDNIMEYRDGVKWLPWNERFDSLKSTKMMMRRL